MNIEEQLEAAERELTRVHKAMEALRGELRERASLVNELVAKRVDSITDAQFMTEPETLAWLIRQASSNGVASRRLHTLDEPDVPELRVSGIDGREEYEARCLPALRVQLNYQQNVDHVPAAVKRWTDTWGLGRTDLIIGVLEHDLSSRGVWSIKYDLRTEVATVYKRNYSSPKVMKAGTLAEVFRYVADYVWYEDGPGDDY